MTDDDPKDNLGFDDVLEELDEDASFTWEQQELEPEENDETVPVVCVRIGDDLFGLPGETVREIMDCAETTPLPGSPEHIDGVTVVRRRVLGLLSFRRFLGIDAPVRSDGPKPGESVYDQVSTQRTVLVETDHYAVGIHVDEVTGLEQWPASSIDVDKLPDNIHDGTRRYATGARRRQEGLCIYLNVEKLLDDAAT